MNLSFQSTHRSPVSAIAYTSRGRAVEFSVLAGAVAALVAMLYATFDVFRHAEGLPPADLVIAMIFCVGLATPAAMLLALFVYGILALAGRKPDRAAWVGGCAAAAFLLLGAALILCGTYHERN